jgi:tetratricopeptide (TPR) repeat protein
LHGDPAAGDVYDRADSLAELASRLDPEWVDPSTLRARIAFSRAQDATEPAQRVEWVGVGMERVQTALALEPDHPSALEVRGGLRLLAHLAHLAHDPQQHADLLSGARQDLERAVRLDRSLASAHAMLSVLYYQPGIADLSAAALAARQAYEADAYLRTADDVLDRLFWTNLDLGQFAQAHRWCEEGAGRFPEDSRFISCRLWLMTSPGANADIEEGWSIQRRLAEGSGGQGGVVIDGIRASMLMAGAIGRVAEGLADANRRTELADSARRVLERAHEDYVRVDDPSQELLSVEAFSWVILDDFERAIERWKVYASVNHGFQQAGDISWRWRELREHPRFQEVITQDPRD